MTMIMLMTAMKPSNITIVLIMLMLIILQQSLIVMQCLLSPLFCQAVEHIECTGRPLPFPSAAA